MKHKRVTITEVAQKAGVSRQTVSRAMNNRGEISEETRARVLRIANEMDYRPSSIARSLATHRTDTLGLVIPDVANPFFSEVVRGAEHEAYAKGYNVVLCNTNEDAQREASVLLSLEELRVDGVLLCSSRLNDEELHAALAHQADVILFNRRLNNSNVHSVIVDDETGGYDVTQHLIQTQHHKIGFLSGPTTSHSGIQRDQGYRRAMTEAGLTIVHSWIAACLPTVEGGQQATYQLLNQHPELTALFCYNDLVAVGALKACADIGRKVPDDIAIVGFDDIPLAALVTPALTTCHVPRYALGRQAMQLLLERIGGCTDQCRELIVRPTLVVRHSSV